MILFWCRAWNQKTKGRTISMSNPGGIRMLKGSSRGNVSAIRFLQSFSQASSPKPSCMFRRSFSSFIAGLACRFKISVWTCQIDDTVYKDSLSHTIRVYNNILWQMGDRNHLPRLFYIRDPDFLWRPSHPENNTQVKWRRTQYNKTWLYNNIFRNKSYIAPSKVKPVPYDHENKLVQFSFLGCFFNSLHTQILQ